MTKIAHPSVTDILTVLSAIHLSSKVKSDFKDRGGLMIVGPPGILKSTMAEHLEKNFPDVVVLSDINVQMLGHLKARIAGGLIRTIVFPEIAKIYERHPTVAKNVEGHLRAMTAEGFSSTSFQESTISRLKARATVVGAMTDDLRETHAVDWEKSGFSRRFLWSLLQLDDPLALDRAVLRKKLLKISSQLPPKVPNGGFIPDYTAFAERELIHAMVRYQPWPNTLQLQLLIKTWAVLKWWSREQKRFWRGEEKAWGMLERFALSLGKEGTVMTV